MSFLTKTDKEELKARSSYVLMMYMIWGFGFLDAYLSNKFGFNPLFEEEVSFKDAFTFVSFLILEVIIVVLIFRKRILPNRKSDVREQE
jgi:hypothetical protein